MKRSFEVGDKVKILPKCGSLIYFPSYTSSMQEYVGQIASIIKVFGDSCQIDLDHGSFYWPFRALQLVTSMDETVDPHNLKNGDYIKLTNSLVDDLSFIYIFEKIKNGKIYRHASYDLDSEDVNINPSHWTIDHNTKITYATEEEKKLLDNALLEQGYKWNNSTKQLDSIGLIDISIPPVDFSSFRNSIQKANDITSFLGYAQEEPQTEIELNLFPKKKHYKLNFNC